MNAIVNDEFLILNEGMLSLSKNRQNTTILNSTLNIQN